jgi:hypothetical protein
MDQIALMTLHPKSRLSYKLTCKGTWRHVFISLRPPPLLGLFGIVKLFYRLGIWSNTQCITPENALHTTRSPPPPVTHLYRPYRPVPEFIDQVFAKTSPKRSLPIIEIERFGLVFAKTGSINAGTVLFHGGGGGGGVKWIRFRTPN